MRKAAAIRAAEAEGAAEASAILARGHAEAEAMDRRAAAFARYNDAAVLQMLIEVLPQLAKEIATRWRPSTS